MGEGKKTRDHGNEIMKNDIALDSFKEVSDVFPFPASMPFFPSIENYMATFRWHDSRCQGFFVYQWCPLLTQCLWKKKKQTRLQVTFDVKPEGGEVGIGEGILTFSQQKFKFSSPETKQLVKIPTWGQVKPLKCPSNLNHVRSKSLPWWQTSRLNSNC